MIYELSCGCEPEFRGVVRTKPGEKIYCPQHGFVTINAIRGLPRIGARRTPPLPEVEAPEPPEPEEAAPLNATE